MCVKLVVEIVIAVFFRMPVPGIEQFLLLGLKIENSFVNAESMSVPAEDFSFYDFFAAFSAFSDLLSASSKPAPQQGQRKTGKI